VFLLETLDVKFSGLIHELYSKQVLSAVERDDVVAEKTSFRANEKLLSVLSRKSPRQFQLFLDALDNCGQQHVRNVVDDRRPGLSVVYWSCFYIDQSNDKRRILPYRHAGWELITQSKALTRGRTDHFSNISLILFTVSNLDCFSSTVP